MVRFIFYILCVFCFFLISASKGYGQKPHRHLSIMADFHYSFFNFGRLHGVNAPVSIQYKFQNNILISGFGMGYGLSNWNFSNDPDKNYNMDINYTLPPYSGSSVTSFQSRRFIELNGTSGHGFRWYGKIGYGRTFDLFGKSAEVVLGGYFTKVNTSFVVKELNDQIIYNYLFGDGPDGQPIPFETEFVIPITIEYLDIGPYIQIRKEIFNDWKIPLGISASYYHGFDKNSWVGLGLYLNLKVF